MQGDTLEEFFIDFKVDGSPLEISSARANLCTRKGTIIHEWDVIVTLGRVTCGTVDSGDTKSWPVGELVYAIELTIPTERVISPIKGILVVTGNTVV